MFSNLKLKQQGMLLVFIPFILEIAFVVTVAFFFWQSELQSATAEKQFAMMKPVTAVLQLYIESSMSLFLYALTKKEGFIEQFEKNSKHIDSDLEMLRKNTKSDPDNFRMYVKLKGVSDGLMDVSRGFLDAIENGDGMSSLSVLADSNQRSKMMGLLQELGSTMKEFAGKQKEEELRLRKQIRYTNNELYSVMWATVLLNFCISACLAYLYRQNLVLHLARVAENCKSVAQGRNLSPVLRGNNEIADLDRLFHEMAAKLEEHARREKGVVEEAVDVICTVDSELRVQSINNAAVKLWGYQKDELLGCLLSNFVLDSQQDEVAAFFAGIPEDGGAKTADYAIKCRNHDTVEMRWTVRRSKDKGTWYCVFRNISVEKETERLKDSMVSMISHDLRTPATSIQVFLGLLEMGVHGNVDERSKAEIGRAQKNCTTLITMISNFLDLEKIDSNSFALSSSLVDLSSILDATTSELEDELEKKGIRLILRDLTRGLGLPGNAELLSRSFKNLLSALSGRTGKNNTLVIEVREDARQNLAELTISGFEMAELNQILITPFRDFVAVSEESEERFVDWINIAHFRAIIALHGGSIRIEESEKYGGNTILSTRLKMDPPVELAAKT